MIKIALIAITLMISFTTLSINADYDRGLLKKKSDLVYKPSQLSNYAREQQIKGMISQTIEKGFNHQEIVKLTLHNNNFDSVVLLSLLVEEGIDPTTIIAGADTVGLPPETIVKGFELKRQGVDNAFRSNKSAVGTGEEAHNIVLSMISGPAGGSALVSHPVSPSTP